MARKKRRNQNKQTVRAIAGASLEVINKRRTERPEQRKASREAALRYVCVCVCMLQRSSGGAVVQCMGDRVFMALKPPLDALCPLLNAPLLDALCPLLNALCPLLNATLLHALCPLLDALCPLLDALCPLLHALCPRWPCSEVKERMKKSKAEKAASKAATKAQGKAPKAGGPARAPGRVGGKR